MPFVLEYDTGSEQLSVLAGKLAGYHHLFPALGRARPVLFWLRSAAGERNLRTWLADRPVIVPIATGAHDHAAILGLSPTGAVWAALGGQSRVALADLTGLAPR